MTVLDSYFPMTGIPVSQAQWSQYARVFARDGVVRDALNGFAVSQRAAGANMSVDVDTGDAVVAGLYGESGSIKNIAVTSNGGVATRRDYVVIRVEYGTPDIIVYIATGDAAGNVPVLTNSGAFWDIAIAQIDVAIGAVSITNSVITDLRWNQYTPGWRNDDLGVDVQRKNLLVNGGFEIKQIAGSITTNNAYAHDRWQLLLGGTSTATVSDETTIVDTNSLHSMKIVAIAGSGNTQIDQKLEDYGGLRGKTIAFSIRIRQAAIGSIKPYIITSVATTYGVAARTTGAFTDLWVVATVGAAVTSLRVGVEFLGSDTVYLDSAMLVIGNQPTTFVPLHPADDLARCLRYRQQWAGNNLLIASGQSLTTTTGTIALNLGIPMGGTPTWSRSAAGDFGISTAAGVITALTVMAFSAGTNRSTSIDCTVGAAVQAAGNATLLFSNSVNSILAATYNP